MPALSRCENATPWLASSYIHTWWSGVTKMRVTKRKYEKPTFITQARLSEVTAQVIVSGAPD
jgi:hypothetical protein